MISGKGADVNNFHYTENFSKKRKIFHYTERVPSQSEACDASVPRGANVPKRALSNGEEWCRLAANKRERRGPTGRLSVTAPEARR